MTLHLDFQDKTHFTGLSRSWKFYEHNSRTLHLDLQDQTHFRGLSRSWKFYEHNSRTFQDLALRLPGPNSFPITSQVMEILRTQFQEAWEPWRETTRWRHVCWPAASESPPAAVFLSSRTLSAAGRRACVGRQQATQDHVVAASVSAAVTLLSAAPTGDHRHCRPTQPPAASGRPVSANLSKYHLPLTWFYITKNYYYYYTHLTASFFRTIWAY